MTETIFDSAASLAKAIRGRRVSSVELTQAYLDRIDKVNPSLNAVVLLDESAMDQARAADDTLAKGSGLGPLHGVPITLKDSHDTAGVVTTGGTLGRAAFVPDRDSTITARLRAAGVVLLGKTNTPELTMGMETANLVYGRTNNPYDTDRTSWRKQWRRRGHSRGGRVRLRHRERHGREHPLPGTLLRGSGDQAYVRARAQDRPHNTVRHGDPGLPHADRPAGPLRGGPGARPAHHSGPRLEGPRNGANAAGQP